MSAARGISNRKGLVLLHGEIKTPPFSHEARVQAGALLRQLQEGISLGPPHSEQMPIIGRRCHELKVQDKGHWWRIFYRIDGDAIVIAEVVPKKSNSTPKSVVDTCRAR